jgi:hypothetical protein
MRAASQPVQVLFSRFPRYWEELGAFRFAFGQRHQTNIHVDDVCIVGTPSGALRTVSLPL